jgi:hypothetical protein
MDDEQIELGLPPKFWRMIQAWRAEPTISQAVLTKQLSKG